MSQIAVDSFETLIRDAGEGYLIDLFRPRESALAHLRRLLADAKLTPEDLLNEYKHNPHKVRAFLQVLATASPRMLVMVWRILHGMQVASVEMEYQARSKFHLRVRLSSPDDPAGTEQYESTDIDDAVVLRHLGVMKMNGHPFFDGFYALNLSGS